MKRLIFAFLLLHFSSWSQSQYGTDQEADVNRNQLNVNGYIGFQTTSMERQVANRLLYGGYISNEAINSSSKKHKVVNKLGGQWSGTVDYYHGSGSLFNNPDYSWLVKGGTYSFNHLNYTDDLFNLLFKGNQSFIGDTAKLTGFNLDMFSFQKIGFGLFRKKDKSSVTFNFINLENYRSAFLSKAELIQNVDGSALEMVLDGELKTIDGKKFDKGSGFSVDVDYRFPINIGPTKVVHIQLLAENVGIAYLKRGVTTYETDTVYQFTGFQYDQLNASFLNKLDSITVLDTLGIKSSESRSWIALPMFFQASKMLDLTEGNRFQTYFGVRVYPTVQVTPIVYGGVHYRFNPSFYGRSSLAYGGFGGVRMGLYGGYISNTIQATLGTDELIGWITKKGRGQSILLKFTWNINN